MSRFVLACALLASVGCAREPSPHVTPPAPTSAASATVAAPIHVEPHASVRLLDPDAMAALEREGFTLGRLLGAAGELGNELAKSPRWASLVAVLDADLAELSRRSGIGPDAPNRPFKIEWLRSERTHFELVGVVPRLDRKFVEPGCGEVRLIYRLALTPPDRPTTRLPMTLNAVMLEPESPGCRAPAEKWIAAGGKVDDVARILRAMPPLARVEVNLQNLHGPSLRQDEDDHAEYLLRAFDVKKDALAPRLLLDTPRDDLGAQGKGELAKWIADHFGEIDDGTAVLPDKFLATRVVSVAPRGLARAKNRPYKRLFAAGGAFARLPYAKAKLVRSPAALVRRLDELSCPGCHESRAIAGFHLLGEERDAKAAFNALALGRSVHFDEEIEWRERLVESWAKGAAFDEPRPFAERARDAPGYGEHCGLGDAGFRSWTCAAGMRCRDVDHDEVGVCLPEDANHPGDACQNARVGASMGADGDRITADKLEDCVGASPADTESSACTPNAYGFTGGVCTDACETLGERVGAWGATNSSGQYVCADIPASEYEADCFPTEQPIEECLKTHVLRRRVRACDAEHPCRDDFACARVATPEGGVAGACVPPYFVFQARVDGPRRDR